MASEYSKKRNEEFKHLSFDLNREEEYHDAMRGYYADMNGKKNTLSFEELIKSRPTIQQLNSKCPETCNPSFWRSHCLDSIPGVYEIIPNKIYQVRDSKLDLSVLTVIRGKTGWIIVDCMSTKASSAKAFGLIKQTVEDLPISGIIITHSHFDHFGGYSGVGTDTTPLYIPEKLEEMFMDETVYAGNAMTRRAEFMYGSRLRESATKSTGDASKSERTSSIPYSKNTTEIKEYCTKVIDGISIDFIPTPNTEAPANMMIYITELHTLGAADNFLQSIHNLLTPRGAKVRSGKVWSEAIDYAIVKYGKDVQVHFGGHYWPLFGNEKIVKFWTLKRDLYKYIHDQTLRFTNLGYTPNEMAELIHLPESLDKEQCCRGIYGSLKLNIKAQYQLYIGCYDGNPANLDRYSPKEEGKRYVKAFGGEEKTLEIGKEAYDSGDYKWAATVLNHLVFCNPQNKEARELLAKTYSQLGYYQECLSYRYSYLTAAYELREEELKEGELKAPIPYEMFKLPYFIGLIAVSVNPDGIKGLDEVIKVSTTDTNETCYMVVSNSVIHSRTMGSDFSASMKLTRDDFVALFTNKKQIEDIVKEGNEISNVELIKQIIKSVTVQMKRFAIIEPKE